MKNTKSDLLAEIKSLRAENSTLNAWINMIQEDGIFGNQGDLRSTTEDFQKQTEQKMRKALSESEVRYRKMFFDSPQPMLIFDLESLKILEVNRSATTKYGYSVQEFLALTLKDIRPEEDIPLLMSTLERSTENFFDLGNFRHKKKNGDILWVELTSQDVTYNGRPARHVLINDITISKKAQIALQFSELKYRSLFNQAPEGIYMHDLQGRIIDVNLESSIQSGYTREELLKMTIFDLNPVKSNRDMIIRNWEQWVPGQRIVIEASMQRKDGNCYPIEIYTGIFQFEESRTLLSIVRDISEHKNAEEALKNDQKSFRILNELMNDYVFKLTAQKDGKFTMSIIAGNYLKATGRKTGEILTPEDWYKTIHPDDLHEALRRFNLIQTEGKPVEFECRSFAQDGSLRWIEVHATPEFDAESNVVTAIYGSVRNITQKKIATQAIVERENKYRHLIEHLHAGVVVHSADTSIIICNQEAANLLGLNLSQIQGKDALDPDWCFMDETGNQLKPEEYPVVRVVSSAAPLTSRTYGIYRPITQDTVWVQVNAYPEFDDDNKLTEVIVTFINITQRKLAEEQTAKSEEKYRRVFENVQDVYYEISLDGILLEISPSIRNFSRGQYAPEDVKGSSITNFYTNNEDRIRFLNAVHTQGKVNDFEIELQNREGSKIPVSITAGIIYDTEGNPEKIAGSMRDISERKKSQIALQESEFLFKNSQRAASIGSYKNDLSTGIWQASEVLDQLFGIDINYPRDVPGWIELIVPEDREMIRQYWEGEIIRKGNPFNKEYRISRKSDGETRWVLGLGEVIFDKRSQKKWLIGTVQDITERKIGVEKLRQSEERWKSIIKTSPDGISIADLDGTLTFVSDRLVKWHGYDSAEEMTGRQIFEFADPAYVMNAKSTLLAMLEGKVGEISEIQLLRKDGSRFYVEINAEILRDKFGNPQQVFLIERDISERKKAEDALRESKDQLEQKVAERTLELKKLYSFLQAIHDNAGLAIITTTPDGLIQTFNLAAEKMLGYRADEIIGKFNPLQFHDREELQQVYSEITNRKNGSDPDLFMTILGLMHSRTTEWTFIHKNGRRFPVKINVTMFEYEQGTLGYIGLVMDVTQEKQALDALKESEERFHKMFHNHAAVMLLVNPETGRIIDANEAARQFYGYQFSETEDINISRINVLSRELLDIEMTKAKTQKSNYFEFDHILASGEIKRVEVHSTPIIVGGQKILFSIIHDITDRSKAEKALRWNESLLKMMASSSPLAFLVIDNRTNDILYFNHRFCEIWGLCHIEEKMQLKIMKNRDIIPDCLPALKDVQSFSNSCKPLQDEENRSVVEDEIPFADGRIIRRFSTQIRGAMDEYHGRLYIFEDITERKDAEEFTRIQRDLATSLSTCSQLEPALTLSLHSLLQLEGIDCGGIYHIESTNHLPVLVTQQGLSEQFIEKVSHYKPDSVQTQLIMTGQPVYGPFEEVIPGSTLGKDHDGILGLAIIPIMHEGKPIGSINLGSKSTSKFHPNIKPRLEALAFQIGGAISRITAEQALLANQQNFKKFFDTIDDFMFILDPSGNIMVTNAVVEHRLDYSAEELRNMHVLQVHPPERREEAGFIVGEMLAGNASFCPVPLYARNGSRIPVETKVIKGTWDDKDVLFGISRDITERQEAEAALRMQSAAFESFALAIIITDIEGRIKWANSGFTKLSGYTMEEVTGTINSELLNSGLQSKAFYKDMWATILDGRVWTGELINRRKDGSTYYEEMTITPVFDHLDAISGFIAIKIDITERKAIERSLMESIEREKELNELKSKFISVASHEFRTPLATILATSESLLSYSDRMTRTQKEQRLIKIKEKVAHLNKIIDEMLHLTKTQARDKTLEPEDFDLANLCREVVEEFNDPQGKTAAILLISESDTLGVFLDKKQIRMVLTNLISNAIKYTEPDKKITVKISKSGEMVCFSVTDEGIGIPADDLKHLFEPFFRASNALNLPGTGLGLNIVQESITRHHGKITVNSKVNIGTQITVILPQTINITK